MISSAVRTVSRGASSEAERELFTIFSGLGVINMQQPAAATTFEGQGNNSSLKEGYSCLDRPYRWLPAKKTGPARLSSV